MKKVLKERGIERLRTLYAIMCGVPEKLVGLDHWRAGDHRWCLDREFLKYSRRAGCGTAACAVGWAAAHPAFRRSGLTADGGIPLLKDSSGSVIAQHWRAVEMFFDLTPCEAQYLFSNVNSRHPTTWELPDLQDESQGRFTGPNDKRKVLARIRFHLLRVGAITPSRFGELAVQEAGLA